MSSVVQNFGSSPITNNKQEEEEEMIQGSDLVGTLDPNLDMILQAAMELKNQVVKKTWEGGSGNIIISDPTVYSGVLGTAFTCLRSYEATGDEQDLLLCAQIVDACAMLPPPPSRHVTFLYGQGGIFSLGAVVSYYKGDNQRRDMYLKLFLQLAEDGALPVGPQEGGLGMSYDLLYGRTGFLWAALFINKYLGETAVPFDLLMPIVKAVLAGGRAGASDKTACPLMYRWHGTRYWGAANGLAGILHVLLHFPLSEEDAEDVKGTLRYMIRKRFPHSGNYPSCEGNPRDKLVQWSHGAGGMAITLSKAAEVFACDREFQNAAIEAGEVVWKRGLVEKPGLSDGASGNAYAFLSLYRLTGESIYKERAKAFASFLYHKSKELQMVGRPEEPNHKHSLFLGLAGTVCLWFDLQRPENSRFPGYEI